MVTMVRISDPNEGDFGYDFDSYIEAQIEIRVWARKGDITVGSIVSVEDDRNFNLYVMTRFGFAFIGDHPVEGYVTP